MSDTAPFVDPVYLNQFGLARTNVLDYFLHPLNPFKTKSTTSNEVLRMQGIDIFMLAAQGGRPTGMGGPPVAMNPQLAEDEYATALKRLNGEQYELVPIPSGVNYMDVAQGPLFTIRHVLRSSPNSVKVLGIYYVLEGVIYKSPSVRSLMKSTVTKTLMGLSDACDALSVCARYQPSTGYVWDFEAKPATTTAKSATKKRKTEDDNYDDFDDSDDDDNDAIKAIVNQSRSSNKRKQRRILDNRRPGERTDEEEEGIRASEAINRILVRLSKSSVVLSGKSGSSANGGAVTVDQED